MKPHLLFLSWRDARHPQAGEAETFIHEMLRRVSTTYRVTHLSVSFKGGSPTEYRDGITYLRYGTTASLIPYALYYYWSYAKTIDLVLDHLNGFHFFTPFYVPRHKRTLFLYQLIRERWSTTLVFPFSKLGEWTETRRLSWYKDSHALTISPSVVDELQSAGFTNSHITMLPPGLSFSPWSEQEWELKEHVPTFLYINRLNEKELQDTIGAFLMVQREFPETRLWLIGIRNSSHLLQYLTLPLPKEVKDAITYYDSITETETRSMMSRATALLFPSIREGVGFPIIEAAAVGTPSIVYDAPGVRDAVKYGMTGYMAKNKTPGALAAEMRACFRDPEEYEAIRTSAHHFARAMDWQQTDLKFQEWLRQVLLDTK
ncbi:glycosyltransferase family 4 protein [Exiguobacterium sp. UBA5002]|uniref:glycosyltransferase family 4 protein n=1 Tax=Exiguobacterium sp. UBA5002 TaxID=1946497 RepID=UPI0025BC5E60|nr:glycosyltransferase family 4 protein [Exiguobacterium sp. UBA5002]